MKKMLRHICFTLNNYTQDEWDDLLEQPSNYTIMGKEVGEKGTPHIQGYMEFKNPIRFDTLKKRFPRIHVEERKGTAKQASDYCKKDSDYVEKGELSNQGKRSDLDRVAMMICENQPIHNVATTYPKDFIKFHRGIMALHNILKPHRTEKPVCYWYHGNTGLGKTKEAVSLCKKEGDYFLKNGSKWWDGYDQQEVVIIDDFRPENVQFDELLRWLDRYKCMVEIKGGSLPLNSPIIVITSDKAPYHYWTGNDLEQVERRLNSIRYFR
ncbi:replication-associated protein [Circovirus sp.]|nr:replication-associated protein [Circovirus sp.]